MPPLLWSLRFFLEGLFGKIVLVVVDVVYDNFICFVALGTHLRGLLGIVWMLVGMPLTH